MTACGSGTGFVDACTPGKLPAVDLEGRNELSEDVKTSARYRLEARSPASTAALQAAAS